MQMLERSQFPTNVTLLLLAALSGIHEESMDPYIYSLWQNIVYTMLTSHLQ
jgi:hypothetical protein